MKNFPASGPEIEVVRYGEKEAVRFVTRSGVRATVATSIDPALLHALKLKLKRRLRRQGLLPPEEP